MQLSRVIAHRGASKMAPENTLIAMQYAKDSGASWVEFDVMLTQDGVPIVIHDLDLKRTTNTSGLVEETSYSTIKTLDAGSWFNEKFQGEKIPTLEAMVYFLNRHDLKMNIEIKPVPGYEIATANKVMDFLIKENLCESPSILLSSFSLASLLQVRKRHSNIAMGLLLEAWSPEWQEDAEELQCVSIHVHYPLLSQKIVQDIKNQGYLILTYTVDDVVLAEKLFSWGVDSIFTNVPGVMVSHFEKKITQLP